LQAAWLLVGFCKIETRLWLKHRIVEGLRKGIIRMCAERGEVVVHLQQGHRLVSRTVCDTPKTQDVRVRMAVARGRLVPKAFAAQARSWTRVLLDRILDWYDAVDAEVFLEAVDVVDEVANAFARV
jgi:hypothetical protein